MLIERLNISFSGFARVAAQDFSTIGGIPSGPTADDDFSFEMAAFTSSSEKSTVFKCIASAGTLRSASVICCGVANDELKTLEKWSANKLQVCPSSEDCVSPRYIFDGRPDSLRFSLTNDQKRFGFCFKFPCIRRT